jgi:hypothetical protein
MNFKKGLTSLTQMLIHISRQTFSVHYLAQNLKIKGTKLTASVGATACSTIPKA